jgi:hypothetical protein
MMPDERNPEVFAIHCRIGRAEAVLDERKRPIGVQYVKHEHCTIGCGCDCHWDEGDE